MIAKTGDFTNLKSSRHFEAWWPLSSNAIVYWCAELAQLLRVWPIHPGLRHCWVGDPTVLY